MNLVDTSGWIEYFLHFGISKKFRNGGVSLKGACPLQG